MRRARYSSSLPRSGNFQYAWSSFSVVLAADAGTRAMGRRSALHLHPVDILEMTSPFNRHPDRRPGGLAAAWVADSALRLAPAAPMEITLPARDPRPSRKPCVVGDAPPNRTLLQDTLKGWKAGVLSQHRRLLPHIGSAQQQGNIRSLPTLASYTNICIQLYSQNATSSSAEA